jgi:hypothetical protein
MHDLEREMTRPCKLVNAQNTVKDDDDIMLVVYEIDSHVRASPTLCIRRWAVYINGKQSGGGIVSTHFAKETP